MNEGRLWVNFYLKKFQLKLTEGGTGLCLNDEHPMKAPFPKYTTEGGNTKSLKDEQP